MNAFYYFRLFILFIYLERSLMIDRQPLKKGGHVILDSCGGDGEAKRHIVSKSNGKILYTSARKSRWGDVYNLELYFSVKF